MAKVNGNLKIGDNNITFDEFLRKVSSWGMLTRFSNIEYNDSGTWQFHTITFDRTWLEWQGNEFLLNSGDGESITIGKGVSLVEVSGWVAITYASGTGALEVGINKNGESSGIINYDYRDTPGWGTTIHEIPPTPLKVTEGDKLTLTFCMANGGNTILYATEGRPAIALKVRVIK